MTFAEKRPVSVTMVSGNQYAAYYLDFSDQKFDSDFIMPCPDRICSECGNDHSFKNNFEDVKTSIDELPELFPTYFKRTSFNNNNKPQEFTN